MNADRVGYILDTCMGKDPRAPEFRILDPKRDPAQNHALLRARVIPEALGSHVSSALEYLPSEELVDCINTALAVGSPLLITGEPGTGKTQAAFFTALRLGLGAPLKLDVNSETTVHDLFYRFDRVAYFHDAQQGRQGGGKLSKDRYVTKGPLWEAFDRSRAGESSIVLLDEIDKAPRDFPNDLLNALDQHSFTITELDHREVRGDPRRPPLVVITSNSEKRLPEPLLRRCIYHYIPFDEQQVRAIVEHRCGGFPALDANTRAAALARFLELRALPLRKKPATGELLVWLTVLSARGGASAQRLQSAPLDQLPALFCLLKDRDDLARVAGSGAI